MFHYVIYVLHMGKNSGSFKIFRLLNILLNKLSNIEFLGSELKINYMIYVINFVQCEACASQNKRRVAERIVHISKRRY